MEQALKQGAGQALSEKGYDPEAVEITLLSIDGVTPTSPKDAAPSRLYRKLIFQVTARADDRRRGTGPGRRGGGNSHLWRAGNLVRPEPEPGRQRNDFRGGGKRALYRDLPPLRARRGHEPAGSEGHGRGIWANPPREILEFYYPGTELKKARLCGRRRIRPGPLEAPLPAATPDAWEFPEIEATPAPAATDPPETIQPAESVQAWVKPQGGTLNFRSAPSVSGRILGSLKNGEQVTVTALEGAWARIQRGGREGYVMARYLTLEKPAPALPGGGQHRLRPGSAGTGRRGAAVCGTPPGATSIARLKNGAFVRVIALKGQWARVETASGKQGYVAKGYLERVYADWQMEQTD